MSAVRPVQSQPPTAVDPIVEHQASHPRLDPGIFPSAKLQLARSLLCRQQHMPAEVMIDGVIYRPTLLASAEVHILDRKHGVDSEITRTVLVKSPEKRGSVRWEEYPLNAECAG